MDNVNILMVIMKNIHSDGDCDFDGDIYPSLWPQTGLGSTHAPPKKILLLFIYYYDNHHYYYELYPCPP